MAGENQRCNAPATLPKDAGRAFRLSATAAMLMAYPPQPDTCIPAEGEPEATTCWPPAAAAEAAGQPRSSCSQRHPHPGLAFLQIVQ